MLIDKPYLEDFFSNIIKETWLFNGSLDKFANTSNAARIGAFILNDPIQKRVVTFNVNSIQIIIFDEKFKDEHYIIGKCSSFFFLAIRKDEDEYPWVSIIKNDTLAPLINQITHFKEMFPSVKAGEFTTKLLLSNKLKDDLVDKSPKQKKINKI